MQRQRVSTVYGSHIHRRSGFWLTATSRYDLLCPLDSLAVEQPNGNLILSCEDQHLLESTARFLDYRYEVGLIRRHNNIRLLDTWPKDSQRGGTLSAQLVIGNTSTISPMPMPNRIIRRPSGWPCEPRTKIATNSSGQTRTVGSLCTSCKLLWVLVLAVPNTSKPQMRSVPGKPSSIARGDYNETSISGPYVYQRWRGKWSV